MVRILEIQQYSKTETRGLFADRTSFGSRRWKKFVLNQWLYTTHHKCTNVLTSDNIQCLSNIPFFYNHIVLTVILGVHTVHYLTHLGCLQVLEKIVFIDGILDQLFRSGNTTNKKKQSLWFETICIGNSMKASSILGLILWVIFENCSIWKNFEISRVL